MTTTLMIFYKYQEFLSLSLSSWEVGVRNAFSALLKPQYGTCLSAESSLAGQGSALSQEASTPALKDALLSPPTIHLHP